MKLGKIFLSSVLTIALIMALNSCSANSTATKEGLQSTFESRYLKNGSLINASKVLSLKVENAVPVKVIDMSTGKTERTLRKAYVYSVQGYTGGVIEREVDVYEAKFYKSYPNEEFASYLKKDMSDQTYQEIIQGRILAVGKINYDINSSGGWISYNMYAIYYGKESPDVSVGWSFNRGESIFNAFENIYTNETGAGFQKFKSY